MNRPRWIGPRGLGAVQNQDGPSPAAGRNPTGRGEDKAARPAPKPRRASHACESTQQQQQADDDAPRATHQQREAHHPRPRPVAQTCHVARVDGPKAAHACTQEQHRQLTTPHDRPPDRVRPPGQPNEREQQTPRLDGQASYDHPQARHAPQHHQAEHLRQAPHDGPQARHPIQLPLQRRQALERQADHLEQSRPARRVKPIRSGTPRRAALRSSVARFVIRTPVLVRTGSSPRSAALPRSTTPGPCTPPGAAARRRRRPRRPARGSRTTSSRSAA